MAFLTAEMNAERTYGLTSEPAPLDWLALHKGWEGT